MHDGMTFTTIDPAALLRSVWELAGGEEGSTRRVTFGAPDPVLPSIFHVDAIARATIGLSGLAAAEIWRTRGGGAQEVHIDPLHAAAAFRSERYLTIDGDPPQEIWAPVSGYFKTGDGRWVQLHCNFPHHRAGVLRILGVEDNREAVAAAIAGWRGEHLERETRAAGLCVAFVRTPEEWKAHPQALALATLPLLEILRIGEAPPEPFDTDGDRPLAGVRVLDLTRVIAGPVCGRTLASHGAEVMRIAGPHLHFVPSLIMDTGFGKRSAHIDLSGNAGQEVLRSLTAQAGVFVNGYRPGAIAAKGFSPREVARIRPGIVYTTLSAYGHTGPWAEWRGFDSLTQSASGIVHESTMYGKPSASSRQTLRPLPCQALDHATGYLAAFGTMMALNRRAEEGGSWLVRVSLAQTGRWLDSLGRVENGFDIPDPTREELVGVKAGIMGNRTTAFGELLHVRPPAILRETPANWDLPPAPLGSHPPEWGRAG